MIVMNNVYLAWPSLAGEQGIANIEQLKKHSSRGKSSPKSRD
jgi:hypothetical protein